MYGLIKNKRLIKDNIAFQFIIILVFALFFTCCGKKNTNQENEIKEYENVSSIETKNVKNPETAEKTDASPQEIKSYFKESAEKLKERKEMEVTLLPKETIIEDVIFNQENKSIIINIKLPDNSTLEDFQISEIYKFLGYSAIEKGLEGFSISVQYFDKMTRGYLNISQLIEEKSPVETKPSEDIKEKPIENK